MTSTWAGTKSETCDFRPKTRFSAPGAVFSAETIFAPQHGSTGCERSRSTDPLPCGGDRDLETRHYAGVEGTTEVLLVFRADSENEIDERLKADPWTRSGILSTSRIARWNLRLGEVDGRGGTASGWSESPGGTCTHWKAPPCHGAHPKRSLVAGNGDGEKCPKAASRRSIEGPSASGVSCHSLAMHSSSGRGRCATFQIFAAKAECKPNPIRPNIK